MGGGGVKDERAWNYQSHPWGKYGYFLELRNTGFRNLEESALRGLKNLPERLPAFPFPPADKERTLGSRMICTARHIENREKTGNEIDKDLKSVERRNFVVLNAKFTADFSASVAYFSHVKHHICICLIFDTCVLSMKAVRPQIDGKQRSRRKC